MRDATGFAEFVHGTATRHLRTAYLLTGNAADADDLLQVSFTHLMRVWGRLKGSPDAYLRTVMLNAHRSRFRRAWRHELATEQLPEGSHDPYAASDERELLRQALMTLSRGERAAVVLRHLEDLPEAEVARLLGCSVGTVKSQTSRGLAKLRTALAPTEEPCR